MTLWKLYNNYSLLFLTYRIAYKHKDSKPWMLSGSIHQDHSTSQQRLQKPAVSCSSVPSTQDQTFNYLEKYVSGKQPDMYVKNSTLFDLKSNSYTRHVSIWFHPMANKVFT